MPDLHSPVRTIEIYLDTHFGRFDTKLYVVTEPIDGKDSPTAKHHLALTLGDIADQSNVLVRVQSRCFLSETFGDLECDCVQQLHAAMETNQSEGQGVLLYLDQEGKDIGLENKMKAIQLCQQTGIDMHDAFIKLGFRPDERNYEPAAYMLDDLGVESPIQLLTNNPNKMVQLAQFGIQSTRVPLKMLVTDYNRKSLTYKMNKQGHLLDL